MTLPPHTHLGSTARFWGEEGRRERESLWVPSDFALGFLAQARLSHDSPALECFVSQSLVCFKPPRSQDDSSKWTGRRVVMFQAWKIICLWPKQEITKEGSIRVVKGPETNSYKMTKNMRGVDVREEKTQGNMTAAFKYVRNCHM